MSKEVAVDWQVASNAKLTNPETGVVSFKKKLNARHQIRSVPASISSGPFHSFSRQVPFPTLFPGYVKTEILSKRIISQYSAAEWSIDSNLLKATFHNLRYTSASSLLLSGGATLRSVQRTLEHARQSVISDSDLKPTEMNRS
jgi:integrase